MIIGPYRVDALETGRFALDGGAMFGVVPKPIWSKFHPADDRNRIELAMRVLLIRDGERNILVDVGIGSKFSPKLVDIYKVSFETSNLESSLRSVGLQKHEITDVILTHLHFDHAGGSTERRGGEVVPTFPNARYYVQKAHWALATQPSEKDRGSFMSEDFLVLKATGKLELLDGEVELFPSIETILVNGHTDAQQLVRIAVDGSSLLYCCDLVPTAGHLPLPYVMAYDLRPLQTIEEKKRILGQASDENSILVFEHDPFVEAARIQAVEKGFAVTEKITFDDV
jgi:glyoxylase-like metal-dependent hydrolase (beta-lactamase superfamily II)